jgi:mannosyl-oligosaccharide alpha-1,2-mannosidase
MKLEIYTNSSVQDDVFQVNHNGVNQFVFNTEAHPVKVAGTPI